jgi:predicted RNase H-like HicB family nuclease
MHLKVLISEGEDGWLVVQCPSIPGCISQGKNPQEALDNIREAIEGCMEVMEERVSKASPDVQTAEIIRLDYNSSVPLHDVLDRETRRR